MPGPAFSVAVTDLGAEPDRSRRGTRPISARNRTDLGAEVNRSRRGGLQDDVLSGPGQLARAVRPGDVVAGAGGDRHDRQRRPLGRAGREGRGVGDEEVGHVPGLAHPVEDRQRRVVPHACASRLVDGHAHDEAHADAHPEYGALERVEVRPHPLGVHSEGRGHEVRAVAAGGHHLADVAHRGAHHEAVVVVRTAHDVRGRDAPPVPHPPRERHAVAVLGQHLPARAEAEHGRGVLRHRHAPGQPLEGVAALVGLALAGEVLVAGDEEPAGVAVERVGLALRGGPEVPGPPRVVAESQRHGLLHEVVAHQAVGVPQPRGVAARAGAQQQAHRLDG